MAFHAGGVTNPTASDIRYYRTLLMWTRNNSHQFSLINSHDKTAPVRDSSQRRTLEDRLKRRMRLSKNFLLLLSPETRKDDDWVPFEIEYAIDVCMIPVIVAYVDYDQIMKPEDLWHLWPTALSERISNRTTRAIHIPFRQWAIRDAIRQFTHRNLPNTALDFYDLASHRLGNG